MKELSILFFVFVFAYIQLFNGFVWISYEVNKSEIIQQFCENKSKPELKCEGTCHMKKMMISEDTEQSKEPQTLIPQILLFLNLTEVKIENTMSNHQDFSQLNSLYSYDFLNVLEIPPEG